MSKAQKRVISIASYRVYPDVETDSTPGVVQCLEECGEDVVLSFDRGTYHFYGDTLDAHHYFVSNNQPGDKRIVFHLKGKKRVTIEGNGSSFIFHGAVVPFVLDDAESIELRGFSIDWERPFYSQGEVKAVGEGYVDIEVDREKYPYHLEGDTIVFDGEGWSHGFSEGIFEMDRERKGPAYLSGDSLGGGVCGADIKAEERSNGLLRLKAPFQRSAIVGNILLLRHFKRYCPAVFMQYSKGTVFGDVGLYHSGAMGVIGQFCEDVTLERCRIKPTPGSDRYFSVTVDATHFVNCRGLIKLKDCEFENQMDDPCNVHGMNYRIKEVQGDRTLLLERVHEEQVGVSVGFIGDRIQLSHNDTLLSYCDNALEAIEEVSPSLVKVVLREPLSAEVRPGDVLENMSWIADLEVTGCRSRNNRARGYLISTPGKVLIANNEISAAGACVKISGDANYWFESGAVRDVCIKNNVFTDCCYGPVPWGRAAIDIDPEIENPWTNPECFHRNIRIENNTFRTFDAGIMYARSVAGISFVGNCIENTDTMKPTGRVGTRLIFDACQDIDVRENTIEPFEGVKEIEVNHQPSGKYSVEVQASL